jgi:hypothetical protein
MSSDDADAEPATFAELVTSASVIATPAPMTLSAPPAVSAPETLACADADAIVTATAAATEIGPPEVDAEGVPVPPEPEPPAAMDCAPAFERSPATWPSTPPDGAELDVPFADAVAVLLVVEEPAAVTLAAPVTMSVPLVVAETECVASVTATAAPTAALLADAEPDAFVVVAAVWFAETTSAPPTVAVLPEPIDAVVVTVESETATDGTIETPPPAAPDCDVVVIEFVLVACTVRLWPENPELFASDALVVSVTRFSATDAPTPEPVVPAVAVADDTVVEVALTVASAAGAVNVPMRVAVVVTFAIVSPSEPATETDAAAPEIPSLE